MIWYKREKTGIKQLPFKKNHQQRKHGASASVTGLDLVKQRLRIYVLMRTSHERKRKELHHSLCLWQHGEIFCVLAFSPFYLPSPFSCMFGICQVGFKRDSDRPPPPPCSHLVSALSGRVCVRVTPTHMAEAFNMNIKQERTLRHAPRFHHLRYRSLEPNAATPLHRRQLRLLADQVYKNCSRLERSIWLNHWLLTQNNKLTRLMQ